MTLSTYKCNTAIGHTWELECDYFESEVWKLLPELQNCCLNPKNQLFQFPFFPLKIKNYNTFSFQRLSQPLALDMLTREKLLVVQLVSCAEVNPEAVVSDLLVDLIWQRKKKRKRYAT